MNKPLILTLLTTIAIVALLGTSWADTPPPQETPKADQDGDVISPEAEVRFPDSWESFPRRDDDVVTRLRSARRLMFPFRGDLGAPSSMPPRFEASRVGPCLAQAAGAENFCEQARAISRMSACVRPEDCQAYDVARQLLGDPEVRMVPANE